MSAGYTDAHFFADTREAKRQASEQRVMAARSAILEAASALSVHPDDDEAWRDLCRARATLKALLRCAR